MITIKDQQTYCQIISRPLSMIYYGIVVDHPRGLLSWASAAVSPRALASAGIFMLVSSLEKTSPWAAWRINSSKTARTTSAVSATISNCVEGGSGIPRLTSRRGLAQSAPRLHQPGRHERNRHQDSERPGGPQDDHDDLPLCSPSAGPFAGSSRTGSFAGPNWDQN